MQALTKITIGSWASKGARLTGIGLAAALAVSGCSGASSGTGAGAGSTAAGSSSAATAAVAAGRLIAVTYPVIAPIRLPDTSSLGAGTGVLSTAVSKLKNADEAGLDIVSPTCDAQGNIAASAPDLFKLDEVADYVNTDGSANVRMTTDKDGTKRYRDLGGTKNLTLVVHRDGSGTLKDLGGTRNLIATVRADGSGTLKDLGGDRNLVITVKADGSGRLADLGGTRNLTITVKADGSGHLADLGGDRNLTIDIPAPGQARLTDLGGDRNLEVTAAGDGSGSYTNTGGENNVNLTVDAAGALQMTDTGGDANLALSVAADRSGSYRDASGDVAFDFGSDGRATDGSGYVISLPENPVFTAPDTFPALGRLGRLKAPCATVLRFASDVLFDFDKATIKPQGEALIAKAAAVLEKAGRPLLVEGYTDAKGSDAYNDDLSVRRAEAFAAALTKHGVSVSITTKGWGEKHPVAANTTASGADNPAGRALNRRVEVVLKG